jgi:riboflavin synthase
LTNLSSLKKGDAINLEVDIIAKYVERMLQYQQQLQTSGDGITIEKLEKLGFR